MPCYRHRSRCGTLIIFPNLGHSRCGAVGAILQTQLTERARQRHAGPAAAAAAALERSVSRTPSLTCSRSRSCNRRRTCPSSRRRGRRGRSCRGRPARPGRLRKQRSGRHGWLPWRPRSWRTQRPRRRSAASAASCPLRCASVTRPFASGSELSLQHSRFHVRIILQPSCMLALMLLTKTQCGGATGELATEGSRGQGSFHVRHSEEGGRVRFLCARGPHQDPLPAHAAPQRPRHHWVLQPPGAPPGRHTPAHPFACVQYTKVSILTDLESPGSQVPKTI